MNANIELIIFDCDGVLIDSEIISATVLIAKLASIGVEIDNEYVQQNFLGCSFSTVKENIQQVFNKTISAAFESVYHNTLLQEFAIHLQPTAGIKQVLSQLNLPFCLATSSSRQRTDKALTIVGLTPFFVDGIFTASEVENGKPAPDLFLHAANVMAVAPKNCLVIEDSMAGVTAALAAGMQVIHYKGGKHLGEAMNKVSIAYPQVAVMQHWQNFQTLQPSLLSLSAQQQSEQH
ncbi:MAG: HAD family hydrolase [Thalassotalea sp.]